MAKLENAILRDPTTYSNRTTKRSRTIGTSGHFMHQESVAAGSLLPSIRILKKEDTITHMPEQKYLREGRFGTCYLRIFYHYKVCVKIITTHNENAFRHEANILSKFNHTDLPYLFGVTVGEELSLITSYHGLNDESVTLHTAVYSKPEITKKLLHNGTSILRQITNGLSFLHGEYKLLHNDIKMDNICLTLTSTSQLKAVIIIKYVST